MGQMISREAGRKVASAGRRCEGASSNVSPRIDTVPELHSTPPSARSKLVLPLPLGPMIATS